MSYWIDLTGFPLIFNTTLPRTLQAERLATLKPVPKSFSNYHLTFRKLACKSRVILWSVA